jgi:hypothetical protein
VEEKEQNELSPIPNLSNDKKVSTGAHFFVTIPFETLHEPQYLLIQCLKELFYAKTLKDLCKQVDKPRNHHPKKILPSIKVGYFRWWHIFLEGYQILKKKWWKGLVGHSRDRGKRRVFFFFFFLFLIFRTLFLSLFPFCHFIYCHFILFLTAINLLIFVPVRKDCC